MINPEMCKPLRSETHGALFKTVFPKLCTVFSTEPKVLQILLLLILTRRKHTYTRGAHCWVEELYVVWKALENFLCAMNSNIFQFFFLIFIYLAALGYYFTGIWGLVPRPGMEPGPPALWAPSPSPWTTRKVSTFNLIDEECTYKIK